ncbi:MAG: hypothetical protein MZV70_16820 [Desulfobacterales bacterium]|nr:hypothetical protein [Desulfobacterales bacterium]
MRSSSMEAKIDAPGDVFRADVKQIPGGPVHEFDRPFTVEKDDAHIDAVEDAVEELLFLFHLPCQDPHAVFENIVVLGRGVDVRN